MAKKDFALAGMFMMVIAVGILFTTTIYKIRPTSMIYATKENIAELKKLDTDRDLAFRQYIAKLPNQSDREWIEASGARVTLALPEGKISSTEAKEIKTEIVKTQEFLQSNPPPGAVSSQLILAAINDVKRQLDRMENKTLNMGHIIIAISVALTIFLGGATIIKLSNLNKN